MVKDFTKKHSKKFFVILAIGVIIGAGSYIYFLFQPAKAYSFYTPIVGNLIEKAAVVKDIINQSSSIKNFKVKTNEIQELVVESAENFKNSAFASVKENMNKGIDVVGNVMGVEQNNNENNTNIDTDMEKCNK